MSRIVWFRQNYLPRELEQIVEQKITNFHYGVYKKILNLCYSHSFWPRGSHVATPFVVDQSFAPMDWTMPDGHCDFNTITNERCVWLRHNKWDRPWLVEWSGGLDSTLIVCALLANLDRSDFDNITIGLTRASLYENAEFFNSHIKPNFRMLDITSPEYHDLYQTHYLVTGEPADLLTGGALAEHAVNNGIDPRRAWRDSRQLLLDFLSSTTIGADGANWLISSMTKDLECQADRQPKVHTVLEWFWWINFAWKWNTKLSYKFHPGRQDSKAYHAALINWFDSEKYQAWSITQGRYSLITHGTEAKSYKRDFRRYIKTIWPDAYYQHFKIKIASTSLALESHSPWACVLDDGSILTAEKDMSRILELFLDTINPLQKEKDNV